MHFPETAFARLTRLLSRVRARWGGFRGVRRLKRRVACAANVRIVVGAGGVCDDDWIPTDVDVLDLLDDRHWRRAFAENSIDAILAEHVWEHLTPEQGARAARNCYRYLKPGGYLRVAVPDGLHPDPAYIEWVRVGGSGPGAADHKALYTMESLCRLFESAGFRVEPLEHFDAQGRFHAAQWDPGRGKIHRSRRFDERNQDGGLHYTSIILDAFKPG